MAVRSAGKGAGDSAAGDVADVIVLGLGATGSAAAWRIAERGARVVGLDGHVPPHPFGSSHGSTRILREAYFEDPLYVPLVRRALALWRVAEKRTGSRLFRPTGGLTIGPPGSPLLDGVRRSAAAHGIPVEELDAAAVNRRYPALELTGDRVALLESTAGVLDPEACVRAQLELARAAGAEIRTGTWARRWRVADGRVVVSTDAGDVVGRRLAICAGPWTADVARYRGGPALAVERVAIAWFEPARDPARFAADRMPIWIVDEGDGRVWYGIPDLGSGLKAGLHHAGRTVDPDRVPRAVADDEVEAIRALLRDSMPAAAGRLLRAETCVYTNTRDGHFLLDRHPEYPAVVVASPCSGHGFKFAPAVGELVADLALDEAERGPEPFRFGDARDDG